MFRDYGDGLEIAEIKRSSKSGLDERVREIFVIILKKKETKISDEERNERDKNKHEIIRL